MEARGRYRCAGQVGEAGSRIARVALGCFCLFGQLLLTVPSIASALPDNRGWELVSPVQKNGGQISTPAEAGPGTFRAATQGGAVAYASKASFAGGSGAAPFSQYVSARSADGWVTQNITPAHLTGAYEDSPYLVFAADLSRALLANPARCPAGDPCPEGFKLRDNLTGATLASLEDPGEFDSASEDLSHVFLRKGADFYRWSPPSPALVKLSGDPAEDEITFFVEAGHLYRRAGGSTTDLTPAGGVNAFLGADTTGSTAYYRVAEGLWRWRQGAGTTQVVTGVGVGALADTSQMTSGVTADGSRLLFTTAAKLVQADGNFAADVYQWQVQGLGTCANPSGCVDLISAGLAGSSTFVGASANGNDVFFTTDRSLVWNDPDSVDLYDARVGGGFPEPVEPPLCVGDACQVVPPAAEDPVLTTTLPGVGNPAERYRAYGAKARCPKGKALKTVKRKGRLVQRCVKVKAKERGRGR